MESMNSTPGTPGGLPGGYGHPMGPGFGKTLGDMKFMGWVGLIYGILNCLSVIGAVVGVPIIIAAHRFIESVNHLDNYRRQPDEAALRAGFDEMGRSFRLMKILTIIQIFLSLGYFAFLFLLGGLGIVSELASM